jgi:hypothetical protein
MRKMLAFLLGLAGAAAASGADSPVFAVRAARLLDVKAGRYVEKPVVVVAGDRIERVGTDVPAGARVIDLRGIALCCRDSPTSTPTSSCKAMPRRLNTRSRS